MKAIFARFGIRTFRPTLRKAEEKLKGLRTAEGPACADTGQALRQAGKSREMQVAMIILKPLVKSQA
jgi:hypothetical protein